MPADNCFGGKKSITRTWLICFIMICTSSSGLGQPITLEERLVALKQAYPGQVIAIHQEHIAMSDGSEIVINDKKKKSFSDKLSNPDIDDMLSQIYPVLGCERPTEVNFDPGRIRSDQFFRSVYGSSKQHLANQLVSINWFGQKVTVNKNFGIPKKLAAVEKELRAHLPSVKQYLIPSAGAYAWRSIAGTNRLSAHSFGIAFDISTKHTEYWRWSKRTGAGGKLQARNAIPRIIIAAFERKGFIWGGRWYHFDTMHFEYRPELIEIGMLAKERGCSRQ